MRKTQLIILVLMLVGHFLHGQPIGASHSEHFFAGRIEKLKNRDCTIISYNLFQRNKTITPRDDKDVGVFYFATGPDCEKCFEETFATMPYAGEEFLQPAKRPIHADSFHQVFIHFTYNIVGDGYTQLYRTSFWGDKNSMDPRDDIYLGSDFIIDSADPDKSPSAFDLTDLEVNLEDTPHLKQLFESNTYFKLREMIINRNLIIDKLRKEKKLKDITPEELSYKEQMAYIRINKE